jgi:hypothetical protein
MLYAFAKTTATSSPLTSLPHCTLRKVRGSPVIGSAHEGTQQGGICVNTAFHAAGPH